MNFNNKAKLKKIDKFKALCNISQPSLKKKLFNILGSMGYKPINEDGFLYAKGTIPVLLVAHMDTVHKQKPTVIIVKKEKGNTIISSPFGIGGDDRCGIYMILEIIKDLKCSVVFTEDEEVGGVGADKFAKSKYIHDVNVNYILEFDRANANDAVFYYGDNIDFEDFVTEDFYKTAIGSYSDIVDIAPALGVAAANLSCGYYNQHTKNEYVVFEEMTESIKNAKELIQKDVKEPFEWIEAKRLYGNSMGRYDDYDYEFWGEKDVYLSEDYEIYYVFYIDENGEEAYAEVDGRNYDDAILTFLVRHSSVPYKNIIDCCPY